jgi:hypothetical protein
MNSSNWPMNSSKKNLEDKPKRASSKVAEELLAVPILGTACVALAAVGIAIVVGLTNIFHPLRSAIVDRIFLEPPWVGTAAVGLIVSAIRNRKVTRPYALLAWCFPLVVFLCLMFDSDYRIEWKDVRTHNCAGPTEGCLDLLVVIIPLVFSFSYSVTALLLRAYRRRGTEGTFSHF